MARANLSSTGHSIQATLNCKGLLSLSIVFFAEGIIFSEAVSFWSIPVTLGELRRKNFHRQTPLDACRRGSEFQSPCSNFSTAAHDSRAKSIGVATSALPRQSGNTMLAGGFANKQKTISRILSMLSDVRGGHSHSHSHANAAAEVGASAATCVQTPWGLPLNGWKAIFQILLTGLNVLCWYVPLRHKSLRENKLGLSLANAFSGGVFLSLAFGHLIPECVHGFPEGYGSEGLPYMIMLAGYMLIFFVEKVAFDAHGMLDEHHRGHADVSVVASASNGKNPTKMDKEKTSTDNEGNDRGQSGVGSSGRSAVILLGALAVHSILEMASLGLSNSFGDCALLALSIGLHQPAESIALLVAFLKSGLSTRQIIAYLSIFSAMGPIGVSLGMAVNQFASPIVDSVMLAVVAGTFIYVGATEVIPEEWEEQENKWKKFFALLSGIISIFIITQYTMGLEV